ncbi:MAG: EpsG family protein [Bacteroidales bacterium]|nr:EpsG family protein [Bacteroidales bacterium]
MNIEFYLNIFIWLLLVFLNINVIAPSCPRITNSYKMFFILVVLFSTFGYITGDYFHYQEIFDSYSIGYSLGHVEPIYIKIAKYVDGNYSLWRFIVWTAATLLYILTMRKLKVNPAVASLCFALFPMFYFCSHRQSLAFSIVFLAIVMLMESDKKRIPKIIAIGLFVLSLYFHRSMLIYIFIFLIAFIPLNRNAYIVILCLFPVIYHYIGDILGYLMNMSFLSDDLAEGYMKSDLVSATLWGKISGFLTQLPIYLLLIYAIVKTKIQKKIHVPKVAIVFLQMSFWQMYISHLFMGQDMSSFLAPRFREDSLMTLGIFYTLYLTKYKLNRPVRFFFWYLFVSNIFLYSYALYKI